MEEKDESFQVKLEEDPECESHQDQPNLANVPEIYPEERLKVELADYTNSNPELFQSFDDNYNEEILTETKPIKKRRKDPDTGKLDRSRKKLNKEIGPFMCIHCGKILQTSSGLASHEKSHTQFGKPEKKNASFECDFCGTKFIQKSYLYVHLFSSHVKHDKGFKCEYCNKFFYKRVRYTNHINSHKNIRNFSCSLCPKTFIQKRNLDVHMR